MFDPRILSLAPFEPHALGVAQRALPEGTYDEAIDTNVKKRYARLEDTAIERIEYKVDGLRITGVFAHPRVVSEKSHPILIFNRGGSGDYGMLVLPVILRYLVPFAEAGYLVFASNYRGNDGGTGTEEFGGNDVHDVLELIDIAKQHPGWDGKNIFMLGGSRGGMMTFLSIRHGAPLNAAATFGAVSDAHALLADRPGMDDTFRRRVPDYQTRRDDLLTDRSPVRWPEALTRVPLLLMHGDADSTIPHEQTEALRAQLEGIHRDMKTVIYPGGNHSLSTHLKHMLDETMAWFDAHRT